MVDQFNNLTQEEIDLMFQVPMLVAILIAGADNNIDKTEMKEAITLSKIKQQKARRELLDYYKEVGQDFEDKLKVLIQKYPIDAEVRNPEIIAQLTRLNEIFPKLDKNFAMDFYASIKDMARKIAESSGGVLGYMSIGYEESKLISLEMIKDPSK
ncbi:MAG: hypothetical protein MJA30_05885 [Cytophagales bacterium]|nr:hypothetical protein [Cytophagales bacterium]